MRGVCPGVLLFSAWLSVAHNASGADFEVQASSALQAYSVTDPWGANVLERRRYLQTLSLAAYNLQGSPRSQGGDYRVVMRLRLNADFGINAHLTGDQAGGETQYNTAAGNGTRYIPGLDPRPVDLMVGYLEGRNLANGLLGFRLGRQTMSDALGFWSFDGGLIRVTTPLFLKLEAFGGAEQRGGLPLSTPRYEAQGMWRGSHANFGSSGEPSFTDYPSYNFTYPAPAFGAAIETEGPHWIHARLSYRRVYNTGTALTSPFPTGAGGYPTISGLRISQERIGAGADLTYARLGTIRGGFQYDLYNQLASRYFGSAELRPNGKVTLGADFDYFVPTFDADSIWNWFTKGPSTTATLRGAFRLSKRFDVAASGGTRLWVTEGDASTGQGTMGLSRFGAGECASVAKAYGPLSCALGQVFVDATSTAATSYRRDPAHRQMSTIADAMGNLAARYRFGSGLLSARGMFEVGSRGSREGVDLGVEKQLDGGRYLVGSRASLFGFSDPTRQDRDAVSFSYVLAAGFHPAGPVDFRLEWEHDMNRLAGQRYRVVGLVNVFALP